MFSLFQGEWNCGFVVVVPVITYMGYQIKVVTASNNYNNK